MRPVSALSAVACALLAGLLLGACAVPPAPVVSAAPRERATVPDDTPAGQRARLRLALATAYYQQGQDTVVLEEIRQALASDPRLALAWNLRGLVYLRMGQWSQAEDSFQQALTLSPLDADIAHNYAWMLCQHPRSLARHEEAAALFHRALAQPGLAQAAKTWSALAQCQWRAGRTGQAELSLRQALRLEPASPDLGLMLAQLLYAGGQWQEAGAQLAELHARQTGTAESLWLAVKAARKTDNPALERSLGARLKNEFGRSVQAAAYDKGLFDE